MHRVTWKRREIVTLVKGFGRFVLGMHKQRAHADARGGGQPADNRVLQQPGTKSFALPGTVYGKSRQEHDRNRVARCALLEAGRCIRIEDL